MSWPTALLWGTAIVAVVRRDGPVFLDDIAFVRRARSQSSWGFSFGAIYLRFRGPTAFRE
jgi:hypothetical protein